MYRSGGRAAPESATITTVIAMLLSTLLLTGLSWAGLTAPAGATEVIGDDERDMFIGTGSLILPVTMSKPGREGAADCPGCSWKATLACDPVSPTACRGDARLCPDDHYWLRIWLRRPGGEWQSIGSDCFGPGGPATRARVEFAVRDRLEQAVPPLRPTSRPAQGVLPHLPVAFHSGQETGARYWTWDILGLQVAVVAQPRWTWQFDDGGPLVTATGAPVSAVPVAGGKQPGATAQAQHIYRTSGVREARVSTVWMASYSVSGLVGLSVDQPVTQSANLPVLVGQGRAILIR